ncbi:MAG: hypothetical protein IIB04_01440 [Acidobacteria bacterium]|nr:hypothetical protein [Acidobacteriota bacterium]
MILLLALLLSLQLGAPFGEADASAISVDGEFVVELSVEAPPGPDAVFARVVDAGRELPAVALAPLGGRRYGGILTLSEVRDVRVAFEARLGVDVVVSELVTLSDLGVDPVVFDFATSPETSPTVEQDDTPSRLPLVFGVVFAFASLVLLAVWSRSTVAVDKRTGNTDNTANADRNTRRDHGDAHGANAHEERSDSQEAH